MRKIEFHNNTTRNLTIFVTTDSNSLSKNISDNYTSWKMSNVGENEESLKCELKVF